MTATALSQASLPTRERPCGHPSWLRRAWMAWGLGLVVLPGTMAPEGARAADLPGVTQAILDATLTTPVSGIVARQRFKEGESVAEGDVIVELDHRLEELEVARRKTALENVTAVLKRTEELAARTKSVALEEVEKQRAEARIAQVELDYAIEQRRRRDVRAPFAGIVASFFGLDPGEGCQPQTPVVRLVDTRRCLFVGNVEARAAQQLRPGQELELRLDARGGVRTIPAEVTFVSPVADPASGLVELKAVFENAEPRVAAGVAAVLRIPE